MSQAMPSHDFRCPSLGSYHCGLLCDANPSESCDSNPCESFSGREHIGPIGVWSKGIHWKSTRISYW